MSVVFRIKASAFALTVSAEISLLDNGNKSLFECIFQQNERIFSELTEKYIVKSHRGVKSLHLWMMIVVYIE